MKPASRRAWLGLLLILVLPGVDRATHLASSARAEYRRVRAIHTRSLGIARPAGLAWAGDAGLWIVLPAADPAGLAGASGAGTRAVLMTNLREPAGTVALPVPVPDPRAVAYDERNHRLLVLDVATRSLHAIPSDGAGRFDPAASVRLEAPRAGLLEPAGMAVAPTGEVFVLDRPTRRILRFTPSESRDAAGAPAIPAARWLALGPLARHRLRGLALEPNGGTLLTLDLDASALVQLDAGGRPTASAGVSGAGLADPRAIVVAPSGDQTDDPGTQSVYVADPGGDGADHGHVIELGLAPLPLAAGEATPLAVQATLVKVTQTSKYLPPSPDPSGLAYDPGTRRLIISDGEVDEMKIWAGKNVFETSLGGTLLRSYDVTGFTHEPAGCGFDPNTRHVYFSDDDLYKVFDLDPGPDGLAGTADDRVRSFSTTPFGSGDPEGCCYDPVNHRLFIVDGVNDEVYVLRPGANGIFDGVAPGGDDQMTHFDTAVRGVIDPETAEYREDTGNLYLIDEVNKRIVEVTTSCTSSGLGHLRRTPP